MDLPQVERVLKRDALGRVELLTGDERRRARVVRRIACGGRLPLSGLVARVLLRRERRALAALAGLTGVPRLVAEPDDAARTPGEDGRVPAAREVLVRSFQPGEPLHRATHLPEDFFDHLDRLVVALHARGVCHNDLHKEQNVIVGQDGFPALIDFQLASCHAPGARALRRRAQDDRRHVEKHRRRYTREGRGPAGAGRPGAGAGLPRTPTAKLWRRFAKPLYLAWTRGVLGTRDGEERRPSSGPWPRWGPPLGPRPGVDA